MAIVETRTNSKGRSSLLAATTRIVEQPCSLPLSATVAGLALWHLLSNCSGAEAADMQSTISQLTSSTITIPGLVGDSQLREGYIQGFLLVFFSEIGDKTFFIALLLALKQSRTAVFAGTFGALAVMTVISAYIGRAMHQLDELLPDQSLPLDDVLAVILLVWFGVQTLQEADTASKKAQEEEEEAGEVVASFNAGGTVSLLVSTFTLVFAAEWGDKSFLATIALAAASDPLGVILGAVTGHGVATGIAVAGGSVLSKYFSESTLKYLGGSLFLVFAAATVFDIVVGAHS